MKKLLKQLKQFTLWSLLAIASLGCSRQTNKLIGRWTDINSGMVLEITSNKLIFSIDEWSQSYSYKVRKRNESSYIVNTKGDGTFDTMTELEICEDQSLISYEMILDGDSHQYRFVKDDALNAELEVQDTSIDLPKEIQSNEFEEFCLYFDNSTNTYSLNDFWPSGRYTWTLEKREDENYDMIFFVTQSSYMVINYREEVSPEYVQGLAKLIETLGIIEINGYYMENKVSSPYYHLYGTYVSGEKISVGASGTPANTCVFDLNALLEYAALQNLHYDENFPALSESSYN